MIRSLGTHALRERTQYVSPTWRLSTNVILARFFMSVFSSGPTRADLDSPATQLTTELRKSGIKPRANITTVTRAEPPAHGCALVSLSILSWILQSDLVGSGCC